MPGGRKRGRAASTNEAEDDLAILDDEEDRELQQRLEAKHYDQSAMMGCACAAEIDALPYKHYD